MLTATLTKSSLAVGTLLAASLLAAVGMGVHQLWAESSDNPNRIGNTSRSAAVQTVIQTADDNQKRQTVSPFATTDDGESEPRSYTKQRERAVFGSKQIDQSEERILAALSEATSIEFFDTALVDAMQFISDLHDITVILDEIGLKEKGITSDEPITQKLSGIPLKNALETILKPLGLAYVVEDGVLKITSQKVQQANRRKPQSLWQ